jgi:hypothetical protein
MKIFQFTSYFVLVTDLRFLLSVHSFGLGPWSWSRPPAEFSFHSCSFCAQGVPPSLFVLDPWSLHWDFRYGTPFTARSSLCYTKSATQSSFHSPMRRLFPVSRCLQPRDFLVPFSLPSPVFSSKSFWALVTSWAQLTTSPRLPLQSGGISHVRCGHRLPLVDLSPSSSVSRLPFWISGFSYFLSPEFTGPVAPSLVPVGTSRSFRKPVPASGARPGSLSVGAGQTCVSHQRFDVLSSEILIFDRVSVICCKSSSHYDS